MPGTTFRMLISFAAFLTVFAAVQYVARLETDKFQANQQAHSNRTRQTDKVHGPLTSDIVVVGTASTPAGQLVVLQATVVTTKPVSNAKFKWNLPGNIKAITGSLEYPIAQLTPDHPYQTQITVQLKEMMTDSIDFVASGEMPGMKFSSVSQYTAGPDFYEQQKNLVLKALDTKSEQKRAGRLFH